MKTVCIMDSISRANGGIFEAERRLQQSLGTTGEVEPRVIGLWDAQTEADLAAWAPIEPRALPVVGPRAFGYAPGMYDALRATQADLGYRVGLWKYPSVATARWSKRTGKPVVVAPHGMLDAWALANSGARKRIAGWLFQNAQLRNAACLRALCQAEAASIRAYGLTNPICVVPNGVDLPILSETSAPRHSRFPPNRRVLLYLGRLHPKKGLAPLVSAWSRMPAKGHDWILAIAGWDQGRHEADLKRQATDFGIAWSDAERGSPAEASLHFLGPQFGEEKAACYRSCDAFILPSLSEGLPMAILEAWAHGKPVLMTPECNLPEGFAASAAIRIESGVGFGLNGLDLLANSPIQDLQAMGARGRALVERRFQWPGVALEMASVYAWVLGGGPRPGCVDLA